MEAIYRIGYSKQSDQSKIHLDIRNLGLSVFFGVKDGKMYAAIAEYKKSGPYRSCGHWHSGNYYYDVYFRVNFYDRNKGNNAYLRVKKLFDSFRLVANSKDWIECYGAVSLDQLKKALCA